MAEQLKGWGRVRAAQARSPREGQQHQPHLSGSPGEGWQLQVPAPSSSDRPGTALWAIWPKKGLQMPIPDCHPQPSNRGTCFGLVLSQGDWSILQLLILTGRYETHTQYSWKFTHRTQALNADKHRKCYTLHSVGVQKLFYSISDTFVSGSTLKIPSGRIHSCLLHRLLHKRKDCTHQSSYEVKTENLNRTSKEEMKGWHQQNKPNKILKEKQKKKLNKQYSQCCMFQNQQKRLINILQSTLCLKIWQKEQLLWVLKTYL